MYIKPIPVALTLVWDALIEGFFKSSGDIVTYIMEWFTAGILSIFGLDFGNASLPSAGGNQIGGILGRIVATVAALFSKTSYPEGNYLSVFFPFLQILLKDCQVIATGLLIAIIVFQLYKNLFVFATDAENPFRLIFRAGMFMVLIWIGPELVLLIYKPVDWIVDSVYEQYNSLLQGIALDRASTGLGLIIGSAITIVQEVAGLLITLILNIAVFWNYLKLALCALERWVVLGLMYYTSPLAFASGASQSTVNVWKSWCKMMASNLIVYLLNIVFLYAYLSAVAYANANGKITLDFAQDALSGNNGVLVWYWATLAVLKVGRQIDQYLSSLGMSVASTASNLGNEALMAAGTMMAGLRTAGAGRQLVDKAARKAGYASAGGALRHGFRSMMGQPQKQQNFSAANKPTSADISRAVNNKGDALSGKGTDNKVGEMVIGGPGVNSEDRIMKADGRTLTEAGIIPADAKISGSTVSADGITTGYSTPAGEKGTLNIDSNDAEGAIPCTLPDGTEGFIHKDVTNANDIPVEQNADGSIRTDTSGNAVVDTDKLNADRANNEHWQGFMDVAGEGQVNSQFGADGITTHEAAGTGVGVMEVAGAHPELARDAVVSTNDSGQVCTMAPVLSQQGFDNIASGRTAAGDALDGKTPVRAVENGRVWEAVPGSITPVDGKRNVSTADFKLVGTEGRDGSFTPYTGAQQVRPGVIADTKYNQAIPGGTTTTYKADATNSRTGNGVSVSGAVSAKVAKSPSEAQNIAEGIGSRIDTDTLGRSPQFRQVSEKLQRDSASFFVGDMGRASSSFQTQMGTLQGGFNTVANAGGQTNPNVNSTAWTSRGQSGRTVDKERWEAGKREADKFNPENRERDFF